MIIVYYSISFAELALNFSGKLEKMGWNFVNWTQNFNASLVKSTLHNIFLYILFNVLIDAIKPNVEKKFKSDLLT